MSLDFSRIFVFVVASFEHDCYYHFIQMRKTLFKKYNIPHMFLFENKPPDYYNCDEHDYVLNLDPDRFVLDKNLTLIPRFLPLMIIKFLKGLQKISTENYDFILRINLSTYINFPKLHSFLYSYPRSKLFAGFIYFFRLHDWDIYKDVCHKFVSGTCMIFSSDVAEHLKTYKLNDPLLYKHFDDTVISHLCLPATQHLCKIELLFVHNNRFISDEELLSYPIIRIKYPPGQRDYELQRWMYLMNLVDKVQYEKNPIMKALND
jgi:hypothetical protein